MAASIKTSSSRVAQPPHGENIIDNLLQEIREGTTLRKVSIRTRRGSRLTPVDIARLQAMASYEETRPVPTILADDLPSIPEPEKKAAAVGSSADSEAVMDGLEPTKAKAAMSVTWKQSIQLQSFDGKVTHETCLGTDDADVERARATAAEGETGVAHTVGRSMHLLPTELVRVSSDDFGPKARAMERGGGLLTLKDNLFGDASNLTEPKPNVVGTVTPETHEINIVAVEEPILRLTGDLPLDNPDLLINDPTALLVSDHKEDDWSQGGGVVGHHHRHVHFGLGLAINAMLVAVPGAATMGKEKRSRKHSFQASFPHQSWSRRHSTSSAQHHTPEQAKQKISLQEKSGPKTIVI